MEFKAQSACGSCVCQVGRGSGVFCRRRGSVLLVITRDSTIGGIAFRFRFRRRSGWQALRPRSWTTQTHELKSVKAAATGAVPGNIQSMLGRLMRHFGSTVGRLRTPAQVVLSIAVFFPPASVPSFSSHHTHLSLRLFGMVLKHAGSILDSSTSDRSHLELDQCFLERPWLQLTVR